MLHIIPLLHNSILHRIRHLKHGSRRCCLVTTHYVLDDHAIIALFFRPEDRSSNDRWILEFGKVLLSGISRAVPIYGGRNSGSHTCAAYPTLRNPVPPSRTIRLTSVEHWKQADLKGQYLLEALPWSQIVEVLIIVHLLGVGATGGLVGSLTRSWGKVEL